MSRVPKWKVEKTKVKVVFRLQFHATHIPPGWDKLFLSLIPSDTGKATAKTTKTNVRNGNCKWSDPIYETTRLLQDTRTKRYDEKLYKLVVAMGSTRSSLLGEVNINLADFADALKPFSITLPLHSCDFGTILHVTLQLLTSKTGFREFEQQREATVKGFQVSGPRSHDPAAILASSVETADGQTDKVNARVRFKEDFTELPSVEEIGESNEDYEDSAAGIDGSSCTSESLYPEKNDISNMHEVDSFKSTTSGDVGGFPPSQNLKAEKEDQHAKLLSAQGSNEWSHGWSSDYSVDNDLAVAYEENNRLRAGLELAELAFLQLKQEAKSLQSITDELGAETQCLTHQLATELASGEKLATEVSLLKSECSKLKTDLEDLKSAKIMQHIPGRSQFPVINTSFNGMLQDSAPSSEQNYWSRDVQHKYFQGLLLIESKIQEIQNKACIDYHGSGFSLHSDFEVLERVLQNLKQGITQASSLELVDGIRSNNIQTTRALQAELFIQGQGQESSYKGHHHSENMLHFLSGPDQVFHEMETLKKNMGVTSMEEKMCELLERLEESNIEKENLTKKMGQMESYYEALIQELEVSQKQTLHELENLRNEHASSLYTTSALQSQIEKMHEDMNEQLIRIDEDRHMLDSLNKELEKRAIASETALKRVRWNYSIAVDRLQKDLELLSFQVLSMYETNENLAKQTFTGASQLFFQQYAEEPSEEYKPSVVRTQPEIASKINYETSRMLNGVPERVCYKATNNFDFIEDNKGMSQTGLTMNLESKMQNQGYAHVNGLKFADMQCASEKQRNDSLSGRSILKSQHEYQGTDNVETMQFPIQCAEPDDKRVLEEMKMSLNMLKKLQSNTEAELSEMHLLNMQWEVFSEVLQKTLHDVNDGIGYMKHQIGKFTQQLEQSTDAKESLMLKLHSALDEAKISRENEIKFTSKCDDLTIKNQILEAKLQDLLEENSHFSQNVAELEGLMVECRVFESKYKACNEEKEEFNKLLKQESLKSSCLQSEISCISEDFRALKEQFDKHSSMKDDMQRTLSFLQEKLEDLYSSTVSCNGQVNSTALDNISLQQEQDLKFYMTMILHLEQFQQEACKTILQLRQEKKEIEEERDVAQYSLNKTESQILCMKQKFESELKEIMEKLDLSKIVSQNLQLELQDIVNKLKISSEAETKHVMRNKELSSKLTVLEVELQCSTEENRDLVQKLLSLEGVNDELERAKSSYMNCMQENEALMMSIQFGNESSVQMENELSSLKESLMCAHDKLQLERKLKEELETAVTDLTSQLEEKSWQLLSFDEQKAELVHLRKRILDREAENVELHLERKLREELETAVADLTSQLEEKSWQLLSFDEQKTELVHLRKRILDLEAENVELHLERKLKEELETAVADLTSQLEENGKKLISFDEQKTELIHLRKMILDLESENLRLQHILLQSEERQRKLDGETPSLLFQIAETENHLSAILEYSLARDVEVDYMKSQFRYRMPELVDQLKVLEKDLEVLHLNHLDVVASLKICSASKAELVKENAVLSAAVRSLKSELDTVACEKRDLVDKVNKNNTTWSEFEEMKARASFMEADNSREKQRYVDEICQLKKMLVSFEKELDNLRSSRDELEITYIILKSKLDEQKTQISYHQVCDNALKTLREQYTELSYKLSEQIMKTEEFKNLSIHLRELKDKADAECHQAREKRENEGPTYVMQESLRIAFIKEQYESKLQELRNQVYVSKKYAEEMLLKLQNALDEVECAKKSEVSLVRRNEELSTKISELEADLQTAVTDRRELVKACDRMKAELECTILSLDCCKEEKQKLECSLQECNEERIRIRVELDLVKRLLENMASVTDIKAQRALEPGSPNTTSIGQLLEDGNSGVSVDDQEIPSAVAASSGRDTITSASVNIVDRGNHFDASCILSPSKEVEEVKTFCVNKSSHSSLQPNLQSLQDGIVSGSALEQESLSKDNEKQIADIKAHFEEQQKLKAGMDLLHKELERLKNENLNSLLPLEDNHFDPVLQDLQRELTQLDMANEHLGSIFPLFKELPVSGNALERVLALEFELAEALQAKKKSDIRFQSSFLKQHNDDEAVYQSFRDINDLIKDMLELKRRHAIVETELREMQGRYSQLSLQFAEVEGERQKLMMSLKNRLAKKS